MARTKGRCKVALRGRDDYDNLSAMGAESEGPRLRLGDFSVASAVAWRLEPLDKSPRLTAMYELVDGEVRCVSVTIEATEHGRGVTTEDLVTMPGIERKGLDAFLWSAVRVFDDEDWRAGHNLGRTAEVLNPDISGLRPVLRRPDLHQVAEVYRTNRDGRPRQAVQLAFHLSARTAARRIREARDAGLLPPPSGTSTSSNQGATE